MVHFDKPPIALGWPDVGSLERVSSREAIIDKVKVTWPDFKPMKAVVVGSQLHKISSLIQNGDKVITYDPSKRTYHLGKIAGSYQYKENAEGASSHQRKVVWGAQIDRDKLSVPTKNTLGSTLSIFEVSGSAEAEIESLASGKPIASAQMQQHASIEVPVDTKDLLEDFKSRAKEFIKDRLIVLDWDEMQEIVAGALRAMGYKTRVSPQGSDRGKDIVASPDGLGLEQPRIVVEVIFIEDSSRT